MIASTARETIPRSFLSESPALESDVKSTSDESRDHQWATPAGCSPRANSRLTRRVGAPRDGAVDEQDASGWASSARAANSPHMTTAAGLSVALGADSTPIQPMGVT